jgi:hypothetical protein
MSFMGLEEQYPPTAVHVPVSGKRCIMGGLMEGDGEVHGKKQERQRCCAEIPSCPALCAVDH